jgi:hypothetical protein
MQNTATKVESGVSELKDIRLRRTARTITSRDIVAE